MVELGKRIKQFRESRGLTQVALAKLLGISRPTLSLLEAGGARSAPRRSSFGRHLRHFGRRPIGRFEGPGRLHTRGESGVQKAGERDPDRHSAEEPGQVQGGPALRLEQGRGQAERRGNGALQAPLFHRFRLLRTIRGAVHRGDLQKEQVRADAARIPEGRGNDDRGRRAAGSPNKYFNYPQTKYLPLRRPDLSRLGAAEITVIDRVLDRLSDMTAAQISEYSHHDVPWLSTEDGAVIPYEAVFYRTAPTRRGL